jgi:hypothetical protein
MIRAMRVGWSDSPMPVLRYFLFVGGALLALLFAVDAVVPKEPLVTAAEASATSESATTENPGLRIRSDRKWPERIVFDTSMPTIVPPAQTAATEVSPPPTAAGEFTAKARVRESFAQFRPADESKPEAKPQPKRKIAKHRAPSAAPQVALVAQQPPRFGFFGNNFFANNSW